MAHDPHRNRVSDYLWRDPNLRNRLSEQTWGDPSSRPDLPPSPGDAPLHSERALWIYIMKGVGILVGGAFLLVNLMYVLFELLGYLGG